MQRRTPSSAYPADPSMLVKKDFRWPFLIFSILYAVALCGFYYKYVPLVWPFQTVFAPILIGLALLTSFHFQRGTLLFIFLFPLINNLPYFFGLYEPFPLAPAALVLALFYFFGLLLNAAFSPRAFSREVFVIEPILKPLSTFSLLALVSGLITFWRYSNLFPFRTDSIYELTANAFGVTTGGAIMSVVFTALCYLTGMAFFLSLSQVFRSRTFLKKVVVTVSLSTCLSLGFGLFQHVKDLRIGNNPISISHSLINATFKDALSFGAFCSLITPLLLGICLAFQGFLRFLSFLLILLSGYLIFSTGAKGGLLSLLISLSLFLILALPVAVKRLRSSTFSWRKARLSSYAIAASLILLIFTFSMTHFSLTEKIKNSSTYSRLGEAIRVKNLHEIFSGRIDTFWKMADMMIKDYPLTGVGIGGFIIESSNYAALSQTPIGTPESAENYALQVTSELGLIGLFFMLWIFWEILKRMFVGYKKFPHSDRMKFLLIGAIAGIAAFLLDIQTHSYIGSYEIQYTFWLLVGLVFGLTQDPSSKKSFFSKRFKITAAAFLVLYGAIHLWNSTHSLSLESQTQKYGLKQEFGLDKLEKTADGREFRWTREYGGIPVKIEKSALSIPLHASHPDIRKKPVRVRIYLVKDFFKHKTFL